MKKAKIGIFCVLLVVLAGLGLVFSSARVEGASVGGNRRWTASGKAKTFCDVDGKGFRVYIYQVYVDEQGYFDYAAVSVPKKYYFSDTSWSPGSLANIGSAYFDDSLGELLGYYVTTYGSGALIPEWDRSYLYFDVDEQRFFFEYRGEDFLGFWIERYVSAYSEGYNEGILAGNYQEGYQDGFIDGEKSKIAKNNEFFYNNIVIWIPVVITVVALASIISIFGIKKKE